MNGKRVRMAVMSAVILSALAVSGCSAEGNKLLFRFFIGFNKKIDFSLLTTADKCSIISR